jgi:hypothetical protein
MGVQGALLAAGSLMFVCALLLYQSRLPELDATNIAHAPATLPGQPTFVFNPERGSVLVTIEYRITSERTREFVKAVQGLRRLRLRNGAERWAMYRDVSDQELWQEVLVVDNWLQHLRMLDRLTLFDKTLIDNVVLLHSGDEAPRVRHGVSFESGNYEAEGSAL